MQSNLMECLLLAFSFETGSLRCEKSSDILHKGESSTTPDSASSETSGKSSHFCSTKQGQVDLVVRNYSNQVDSEKFEDIEFSVKISVGNNSSSSSSSSNQEKSATAAFQRIFFCNGKRVTIKKYRQMLKEKLGSAFSFSDLKNNFFFIRQNEVCAHFFLNFSISF